MPLSTGWGLNMDANQINRSKPWALVRFYDHDAKAWGFRFEYITATPASIGSDKYCYGQPVDMFGQLERRKPGSDDDFIHVYDVVSVAVSFDALLAEWRDMLAPAQAA